MIFKLHSRIEKVIKFQTQGVHLLIVSQSGIYLNGKKIEEPDSFNVAFFLEDFIVFGNLNKLAKYSLTTEETKTLNPQWSYYWDFFVDNRVLISNNRRKNENNVRIADFYFFDTEKEELSDIVFIEKAQIKINKNKGYSIQENNLKSLSLLTGEYEWEVDLGEKLGAYDTIAKVVAVVDGILWIISQRGILFGIKASSGKVMYHLNYDKVASLEEIGQVNAKYFHSLFDEANKKLIGIYRNQYWEIDLTNPSTSLQVFDIEAINPTYFSHPDFHFRGSYWAAPVGVTYDKDFVYFKDIEVATVGAMNRHTRQIQWHTRIHDQEPMVRDIIKDIQISENKLYVLDTGGTLNIYEKDSNI